MSEQVLLASSRNPDRGLVPSAETSEPKHVAIIMDGNRRWARQHELATIEGHSAGLDRAVELFDCIKSTRIECITLFAFASANWSRSRDEVQYLLRLARKAVKRFTSLAIQEQVSVHFIGRRDRLPNALQCAMRQTELVTAGCDRELRLAIDYSSQYEILRASGHTSSSIDDRCFQRQLCPPVDLLIRTGGERRLSDFMLWESAFAELYFSDTYWPDFDAVAFMTALDWFASRQRRFGA